MKNFKNFLLAAIFFFSAFLPSPRGQNSVDPDIFSEPMLFEGTLIVSDKETGIDARVLYSASYEVVVIPGQPVRANFHIYQGWGKVEPFKPTYFYWITESSKSLEPKKFY